MDLQLLSTTDVIKWISQFLENDIVKKFEGFPYPKTEIGSKVISSGCAREQYIDGPTLLLLDSAKKVESLIPKLKQQLLFLKRREDLLEGIEDMTFLFHEEIAAHSNRVQLTTFQVLSSNYQRQQSQQQHK
ncbi:unnamed protein product [Didymodactylos carnosus]|uniref:Uncharacterized protein n=1 Tax=Didymodactylos carnosus TaxID=1234261 RepID=A0A814CLM0_9BILA|nr:unnamed protein product [Didymodactylos carnosus]CAF1097332.1 unnamed protein product [Didymodactylos carnosus]CAF3718164.1 unnamed protein product [Didymodactylos carnosus]CAF3858824.1 unnamed protein product [Didymodactylos carnosus]